MTLLFQRVADQLRVEAADGAPDLVALRVEEDEGGREFEAVHGGEFPADGFLNVQADDVNRLANGDAVVQFLFEPVNGRLNWVQAIQ